MMIKKCSSPSLILVFALVTLPQLITAQEEHKLASTALLVKLDSSFKFTEGPAVDPEGNIYFTDQPNNQILKWTPKSGVSVFMKNAGRSNGMYFDHQGRLVTCADERNEIWRIFPNGRHEVLLDHIQGQKMNGPNDLWIDPKGGIYFTDPFYKRPWWDHDEKPIDKEKVYYLPVGADQPKVVADDLVKPNGIVGSKNGKVLYVADIGAKKTYRYKVGKGGALKNRELLAEMGSDGMTLDHKGNLYLTGPGVVVYNKKGDKIAHFEVPEKWTANVVFGGPNQNILFITAMGSVYALPMQVHGIR